MHKTHIELYTRLLETNGISHRSLNWGSRKSQRLRFQVLLEVTDMKGHSVLDVGCGLADLWSYMQERELDVKYTGLDMTPAMIAAARERFPGLDLREGKVGHTMFGIAFDYVLASGIFAYLDGDRQKVAEDLIKDMYGMATHALAFNMLSKWSSESDPSEYQADPLQIVSYCRSLCPRVVLRHDYLPHDFTIYLYKSDRRGWF